MGESFINVDAQALIGTSQALGRAMSLVEELNGSAHALAVGASDTGHAAAAAVLNDFVSAWDYGLSCLSKDGSALASMLGTAGGMYQATEDEIVKAAGL